jgi:NadR type nicotinamide-nucleotide adenylyltransferase
VAVVGAESTGKTTLARALAAYFHTAWAPEFARAYLAAHPGPLTPAGLLHIAREQAASEERQARLADRLLISDTDALTTCLWHERYFGACPPELERLAAGRLADFYLLCGPEVPWVADGLRDSPDWRPWFHRRFQDELSARARPYQVLIGSPAQRLAAAIQAITPLLAAIPA